MLPLVFTGDGTSCSQTQHGLGVATRVYSCTCMCTKLITPETMTTGESELLFWRFCVGG